MTLPPIPEARRREEDEFWKRFEGLKPAIFGALCTTLASVLRILPSVAMSDRPRMADFARWGIAVERALAWPDGPFLRAYQSNLRDAEASAIDADPVASAVVRLIERQDEWIGTPTELLQELDRITPENRRGRRWPTIANHLTGQIRRAAVPLRQQGIMLDDRRTGDRRMLILRKTSTETTVTNVTTVNSQASRWDGPDDHADDDDLCHVPVVGVVTVGDGDRRFIVTAMPCRGHP